MNMKKTNKIQTKELDFVDTESFYGLDLIIKDGVIGFVNFNGHRLKSSTYVPMVMGDGSEVGHLPITKHEALPKRLRLAGRLLCQLTDIIDAGCTREHVAWILRASLKFVGNFVRLVEVFGLNLNILPENLDFAFGLNQIDSLSHFKSTIKSSLIVPIHLLTRKYAREKMSLTLPLKGRARRYFIKYFRTRTSMRKLGFAQSYLIGVKKCAPSVPEDVVVDACDGCLDRYQAEPRQNDDVIRLVLTQCRKITQHFTPQLGGDVVDFSLRSTLESNRKKQGSYGAAVRSFGLKETYHLEVGAYSFESGLDVPSREDFLGAVGFRRAEDLHVEGEDIYGADSGIFTDYTYGVTPSLELPLSRCVVGLCEPLKVRCITISHWWESPLWAPLQKQLLRYLSRYPEVCSGVELKEDYFDDFVQTKESLEQELGTKFLYVSDDGDAATDSICLTLCNKSIRDIVPEDLLEIYDICSGLTGDCQVFQEGGSDPILQTNSQLMGDRLSFVKLTVIHLAFKYVFMARMAAFYGKPFRFWRKLIKINGDDGLVAIPEIFVNDYLAWMDNLWNINRIKTQVSDSVFTLNSRMFKSVNGVAREVPFYRLNLIERVDRGGNFLVNPQVWNEILVGLKGSPRSDIKCLSEKRAWADFHRNWIGTMRFLTEKKGNNYFLPEVVGGLGLVPPSSLYFWTTLRQNYAISIVGKSLNKEGKSPKFRTRVVPVTKSLNGVTRKIVNKTPMGVVDFDTERPEFSGTARVKSITTNTKLYTAFLPKGECKARPTLNELASWCYGNLHSQGKPSLAEKLLERLGLQGSDGLVAVPNE